jgi:hypothetical protein
VHGFVTEGGTAYYIVLLKPTLRRNVSNSNRKNVGRNFTGISVPSETI